MLSKYGLGIENQKGFRKGKEILNKYHILEVNDIDLKGLVYVENGFLKHDKLAGAQGRIVFRGDSGLITISNEISQVEKRRFVLAHELGHLFMHKNNTKKFYNCDSQAFVEWNRKRPEETEANNFASELLMPTKIFKKEIGSSVFSFPLINHLQKQFITSFTSTAIRYVRLGNEPCCLIGTERGIVKWHMTSDDFPDVTFARNIRIPDNTVAHEVITTRKTPTRPSIVAFTNWFPDAIGSEYETWSVNEQCIYSYQYNEMVLSMLWIP